jgi:hypothetical protein
MTADPHNKMNREIAADEAWLDSVWPPDPTPPAAAHLRTVVELRVEEDRLADHWHDEVPAGLTARVKQRIAGELAAHASLDGERAVVADSVPTSDTGSKIWRLNAYHWAGGLAAAAALVLGFLSAVEPPSASEEENALYATAFLAFDEPLSQAWEPEDLSSLRDRLDELERTRVVPAGMGDGQAASLNSEEDGAILELDWWDDWS